jgi:hypothetical protein
MGLNPVCAGTDVEPELRPFTVEEGFDLLRMAIDVRSRHRHEPIIVRSSQHSIRIICRQGRTRLLPTLDLKDSFRSCEYPAVNSPASENLLSLRRRTTWVSFCSALLNGVSVRRTCKGARMYVLRTWPPSRAVAAHQIVRLALRSEQQFSSRHPC